MIVIIDTNVLFSALMKDSLTRNIILNADEFFLFPSFIFEEMEEHKGELIKKSSLSTKDFSILLQQILKRVLIVPSEILYTHREEALRIVKDIDIDDVIFVSCALAYPNSIIWSDDKKLKRITKITVLNTKEIKDKIRL